MKNKRKAKVGDKIDGRCTKCKIVREHTVLIVEDDVIKKVECSFCKSNHKFYPPLSPAAAKTVKTKKETPKPAKLTELQKNQQLVHTEWRNAVEQKSPELFKPYLVNGLYQADDLLSHPQFGQGVVKKILGPGKMEVLFEDSIRRLVFNRRLD